MVVEKRGPRHEEDGLPPREATIKTMGGSPARSSAWRRCLRRVRADGLFRRHAQIGAIYRQFSLTIVAGRDPFVVVAVVLTCPCCCSTFLKPGHMASQHSFFGWFNRVSTGRPRGLQKRGRRPGSSGRRQDDSHILGHARDARGLDLYGVYTSFLPNEDRAS